jgi:Dynein heavy chain, N-terminal region 2
MWSLQVEFDTKVLKLWIHTPLKQLDPEEVEADFKKMLGVATKLANRFENMKDPKVTKCKQYPNQLKKALGDFKEKVPVIRALCN